MTTAHEVEERATENRLYIAALLVVALVLPAMAIAFRLGSPEQVDPTAERFVIAALALLLAAGGRFSPRVARHLPRLTQVLLLALGAWVLWYAGTTHFAAPDFAGMIVYQFGLLVVSTRVRDVLVNMTLWLLGIGLMLLFVERDPVIHPAFLLGMPLALAVLGGAALSERSRLLARVRATSAALERRVQERTAELQREVDQRRRAEISALTASRAKSVFLARMSHELRTPINAIVGYTELVREEVEDPQLSHDLQAVLRASNQLLRLVDDVLDVSRIEAGRLDLQEEEILLSELVDRAVEVARPTVASSGNALVVEDVPSVLLRVDPARAAQVLINLLQNAARFTERGRITVSARATGNTATIEVRDSGRGIPEEAFERIFEPFAQVDESARRDVDGAGLGLAIGRDLATRMGGTLTVRSVVGEGSVFTLILPRRGETARFVIQPDEAD